MTLFRDGPRLQYCAIGERPFGLDEISGRDPHGHSQVTCVDCSQHITGVMGDARLLDG